MDRTEVELDRMARAWRAEREGARARFVQERRALTLAERVERGLALRDLAIDDTSSMGFWPVLWLRPRKGEGLRDLRVGEGDPVALWFDDPDEPEARGVVTRRRADRLAVVLDGRSEVPERLWDEGFRLDRESPEVTFDRGDAALRMARGLKPQSAEGRLLARLLGAEAPEAPRPGEVAFFDQGLEDDQRLAVRRALGADGLSLLLGPPGTGKTRTLSELVRQAVARGERVLLTGASNAAVDNLAERLAAAGVGVVRLGHPARVAPALEERTLEALLEKTDVGRLARKWQREAHELRQAARKKGRDARARREAHAEASALLRDAAEQTRNVQRAILDRAPVLAATASVDPELLRGQAFGWVVLDEATQAPDPVALGALLRAPRAVLAGDPHQLPPTVVAAEAAALGLGSTLFERLAAQPGAEGRLVTTLRVQHRMHRALMAFPSEATYGGALRAAAAVAEATLDALPSVAADALRPGPLALVDAAGRGWDEERQGDDPSTSNPAQAERVAAEVRRLLGRGVAAADVGVITPYHAQVRRLRDLLEPELALGLEVSTVDAFQGREKQAIVVDLVRSNDEGQIGFLADVRRMNVALTRARRFLLIVGDGSTLGEHPYYAALLAHAQGTDAWLSAWSDEAPPWDEAPG